jgi:hypothetical protein
MLNSVIETHDNYPDGLLVILSTKGGPPRIIVPLAVQENLVKQAHSDIHHQNHRKGLIWIGTLRKFARLASNVYSEK